MARRRDRPRALTPPGPRPPAVRELSAGGLVYRRRGTTCEVVLAARRHPQSGALVWTIPKGHLEAGETPEAAAVREVREETGLVAEIERPLGTISYWFIRKDEAGRPVRVLKRVRFFLMRATGGRFRDRDQEMDAVRWFPLEDAVVTAAHANERELVRRACRLLGWA